MEWVLGVLIIILAVVAIFVIYLSERVTVFETLLGINPKVTGEKLAEHVNFGPNPFGELSGKDLWRRATNQYSRNCGPRNEAEDIKSRYSLGGVELSLSFPPTFILFFQV